VYRVSEKSVWLSPNLRFHPPSPSPSPPSSCYVYVASFYTVDAYSSVIFDSRLLCKFIVACITILPAPSSSSHRRPAPSSSSHPHRAAVLWVQQGLPLDWGQHR
jgi:hypothetical protein